MMLSGGAAVVFFAGAFAAVAFFAGAFAAVAFFAGAFAAGAFAAAAFAGASAFFAAGALTVFFAVAIDASMPFSRFPHDKSPCQAGGLDGP